MNTSRISDIIVGFLAALFGISTAYAQSQDVQSVFRQVSGNIVAVQSIGEKDQPLGDFSAVSVAPDTLVTRCEAVEGATTVRVIWQGQTLRAEPTQRDTARGLCLLRATLGKTNPIAIAPGDPAVGSTVLAISHVAGIGITISSGVIASLRKDDEGKVIQFSAPIAPGASGGGLFDMQGRLVGIIDYRFRDGQNINFALPATWIRDIPARAAAQKTVADTRDRVIQLGRASRWQEMMPLTTAWSNAMPRDGDAWYWHGMAQWGLKQPEAAASSLARAAKLGEVRDEVVASQVYLLAELKRLEEARDILQTAIAQRKESPTLWLLLGHLYRALGRIDEARDIYRKVTEFNPWSLEAYNALATIAGAKGDLNGMIHAHRQVTRIDPTAWRAWLVLADDYLRAGAAGRASVAVDRAEILSKERAGEGMGDVLYFRGKVALGEGRFREALDHFQKSLDNKPWSKADVLVSLGDLQYGLHLYAQATDSYRQALKLQPALASAKQGLIIVLKDNGRATEALGILKEMQRESPKDPFVWRQTGFAYAWLGQPNESMAALREALKIDPKQPKVWSALAVQATLAGKKTEAMSAYETLLGMDVKWADVAYKEAVRIWEIRP